MKTKSPSPPQAPQPELRISLDSLEPYTRERLLRVSATQDISPVETARLFLNHLALSLTLAKEKGAA